jgi:hypothetical protein
MDFKSGVIETLYFYTYYAYLLGNLKDAEMYYGFLKEEFKESGRQDSLEAHQLLELKRIKHAICTGDIAQASGIDCPVLSGPQAEAPSSTAQKELVKEIFLQGTDQLKRILDEKGLYLYNIEHPCGEFGNVDMAYRGEYTAYPIEVKKDQGKHDLIGQINKYVLFHRLQFHLKHYKFVKPVTICQSYLPYVQKELKKYGVLTLIYQRSDNALKLVEI